MSIYIEVNTSIRKTKTRSIHIKVTTSIGTTKNEGHAATYRCFKSKKVFNNSFTLTKKEPLLSTLTDRTLCDLPLTLVSLPT